MLHSPEVILAVCWQVRLSDGWYDMAEALYTYAWVQQCNLLWYFYHKRLQKPLWYFLQKILR